MEDRVRVEGLPAAPLGHYWAAGAAMGTVPVACSATAKVDDIATGIVPELRQVLDLAMNDESDLKKMLEVAVNLLTKARSANGRFGEGTEMVDAALVVVTAVYEWMAANTTPGTIGFKRAIANNMRAAATRMIANASRPGMSGPPRATASRAGTPALTWESSPAIREEFGNDKDAYVAYNKAGRAGLIQRFAPGQRGLTAVVCSEASPGQAGTDRERIIQSAGAEWDALAATGAEIPTRAAFIDGQLMSNDQPRLADDERAALPEFGGEVAKSRLTVISAADEEFRGLSQQERELCGRAGWINLALRDASLPLLSETERERYPDR